MVIILIGVLSALGIGLFTRSSAFSPLLATQQLQSATLLAQQAALAGNPSKFLRVRRTSDEFQFKAGGANFAIPKKGSKLEYNVGGSGYSQVPLEPDWLQIEFDRMAYVGNPYEGQNIDFRISGDSEFEICLSSLGAIYQGRCQ